MHSPKTITDPLYGSVALSHTESKIVSSRTFQRLHNIRQLGLAHYVFPSAGYSRFAHSVGALRNASALIDALRRNSSVSIDDDQIYICRMAALLHDVGHYPFSHTTEHCLSEFFSEFNFKSDNDIVVDNECLDHEDIGARIINYDSEINDILSSSDDFCLQDLEDFFLKSKPNNLFGIISSDLDCDRLDYLARTSYHSGMPYGKIDVNFIVEHAVLSHEGALNFTKKASKAIDHFLIGRYFDYMQMVFHKTVVGLEWSLKESLKAVFGQDPNSYNAKAIENKISIGEWSGFDDSAILSQFRTIRMEDGIDQLTKEHIDAVLNRRPAKRLWVSEKLGDASSWSITNRRIKDIEIAMREVSDKFGICGDRFKLIKRNFKFMDIGSHNSGNCSDEEKARSIKVLDKGESTLLVDDKSLLINTLSPLSNQCLSIYYLPRAGDTKSFRRELSGAIERALQ